MRDKILRDGVKQERMSNLKDLFEKHGVRHFSPAEVVRLSNPNWPFENVFPPPIRMHENMMPTIQIADDIRHRWGGPVVVLSGYRPNTYNELIGGASDSQHLYFRALDIRPSGGQIDEFFKMVEDEISMIRSEGQILGMGKYYKSNFIHIDTGHYSYNRDWNDRG